MGSPEQVASDLVLSRSLQLGQAPTKCLGTDSAAAVTEKMFFVATFWAPLPSAQPTLIVEIIRFALLVHLAVCIEVAVLSFSRREGRATCKPCSKQSPEPKSGVSQSSPSNTMPHAAEFIRCKQSATVDKWLLVGQLVSTTSPRYRRWPSGKISFFPRR
jgi:hypothetical protein